MGGELKFQYKMPLMCRQALCRLLIPERQQAPHKDENQLILQLLLFITRTKGHTPKGEGDTLLPRSHQLLLHYHTEV